MYSVEQLQAVDYLLKKITRVRRYPFYEKNLKLVVMINDSFWYGDFVQFDDSQAYQMYIDDDGDVEKNTLYATGGNASVVLKQIWDVYIDVVEGVASSSNPFKNINTLPLFFETLLKLLDRTEIVEGSSPFHPYLLNANSLDGRMTLPFINLEGGTIKIVSLIEIKD